MRVLGIDTSTKTGSVALIQGESTPGEITVLAEYNHDFDQGRLSLQKATPLHSRGNDSSNWLVSAIDHTLQEAASLTGEALSAIDGIAVVIGPGAFTGLRVGIATAKGLGYALGVQVAGITSLDALAANVPSGIVCPIMDAMRGEVYAALYKNGERISEYMLIKPEDLAQRMAEISGQGSGNHQPIVLLGDGVRLWKEFFAERLPGMVSFAPSQCLKAATAANLGLKMLLSGKGKKPEEIVPLYLRVSNAEERCG